MSPEMNIAKHRRFTFNPDKGVRLIATVWHCV
jgi:hypothetical protein